MRKMNRNALTLVTGLIIATFGATPALAAPTFGVLYDIDFEDPPHKVNQPPAVGVSGDPAPRDQISNINFGTPTVVNGFGALTSQVLTFDSTDGTGDQIRLDLDDFAGGLPANGSYVFESEISIAGIVGLDQFRFFLDTPIIRRIEFKSNLTVTAFVPGVLDPAQVIGTFTFGSKINLRVEVDLFTDNWKIFLDGVLKHDGSFGGATAINKFRFTTAVVLSPAGATAAIDNVFASVAVALGDLPSAGCPLPADGLTTVSDKLPPEFDYILIKRIGPSTDSDSPGICPASTTVTECDPGLLTGTPGACGTGDDFQGFDTIGVATSGTGTCDTVCKTLGGTRRCFLLCF